MSDFTYAPSYGSALDTEAKILEASFGDGYVQRAGDGINTMPQIWSLTFENLTSATADAIIAFFRSKGGATNFTWTPPGMPEAKFVCKKWKRIYPDFSQTVTATFEQDFAP